MEKLDGLNAVPVAVIAGWPPLLGTSWYSAPLFLRHWGSFTASIFESCLAHVSVTSSFKVDGYDPRITRPAQPRTLLYLPFQTWTRFIDSTNFPCRALRGRFSHSPLLQHPKTLPVATTIASCSRSVIMDTERMKRKDTTKGPPLRILSLGW